MNEQLPTARADPPEYFERPPQPPRRRLGRRSAVIGGVIALLAVVGLGWLAWELTHPDPETAAGAPGSRPGGGRFGGGPGGPGGRAGATTVGFAAAESADIPVVLDALGTVVPQATVRVRPQVSGVLQRVLFKEGQMVKKGELLATIDPRPFEAALQQAMGARQRNEAQLEAARVTLQRYQTLLKQDSIARQDVDTQAAQVRQLEGSITTDRASEQAARLNLAYTRIVAPISGRVGLRPVDVGNVVGPGDANGIALITQLTPIDVEFAVPQDHASWLQHNSGAFMEVKAFDRTRTELLDTGVFASLDNQVDPQTGTVRAKARFNNARMQLFPSQFVNVKVELRTIRNAVVVPVAAIRQGGAGDYVFVLLDNRTVHLRPVVRGQALGDRVQVASGLQIGEKVITEGADRLRDGSRVMLPGDAPRGPGGPGGREGGRRRGGEGAPQGAPPPQQGASAPFTGPSAAQSPPPNLTPEGGGANRQALTPSPTGAGRAATPSPSGAGQGREQRAPDVAGPGATPPWAPASAMMGANRGEGLTPEQREERRKRMEAMSPEERAAMRERFRQRREAGGAGSSQ